MQSINQKINGPVTLVAKRSFVGREGKVHRGDAITVLPGRARELLGKKLATLVDTGPVKEDDTIEAYVPDVETKEEQVPENKSMFGKKKKSKKKGK